VLSVVSPCGLLSSSLLVVGASGLCTPGPVRLDGAHRPPALFLLRGIRRAAPAQVTACRIVTFPLSSISALVVAVLGRGTLLSPTLSLFPFKEFKEGSVDIARGGKVFRSLINSV